MAFAICSSLVDRYFNSNFGLDSSFLSIARVVVAYRRMEFKIIAKVNAEPIGKGSYPKFEKLVEGLCVAHGFRDPNLFVITDSAPNMMMVGKIAHRETSIVTTGFARKSK